MSAIITISDIHGRYDDFVGIMKVLKPHLYTNRLILLGDYIGYGEKSLKTLELVNKIKNKYGAIVLKGNWEDMLYVALNHEDKYIRDQYIKVIYSKGGKELYKELLNNKEWFNRIVESMEEIYMEQNYIFSHSGIDFNKELDKQEKSDLLWNFNFYNNIPDTINKNIVAGHVINKETSPVIEIGGNRIYNCDFGASRKGENLRAMILTNETYGIVDKCGIDFK